MTAFNKYFILTMCYWHHMGALDGFSSFYLVSKFDWNSIFCPVLCKIRHLDFHVNDHGGNSGLKLSMDLLYCAKSPPRKKKICGISCAGETNYWVIAWNVYTCLCIIHVEMVSSVHVVWFSNATILAVSKTFVSEYIKSSSPFELVKIFQKCL